MSGFSFDAPATAEDSTSSVPASSRSQVAVKKRSSPEAQEEVVAEQHTEEDEDEEEDDEDEDEDDESEEEERGGRRKERREGYGDDSCPLLRRIEAITKRIGFSNEAAIGTALFEEVQSDASLLQAQKEKLAASYAQTVTKMVRGNSDYRGEFGGMDTFFAACIDSMAPSVMKACADAGKEMFCTDDVPEFFSEGWAKAIIRRSAALLSDAGYVTGEQISAVSVICDCVTVVDEAGEEYAELLQGSSELRAAIQSAIKALEALPSDISKQQANAKKTALRKLLNVKSAVASDAEKIEALEESIDIASKKYGEWGRALLNAQNASCNESPADLAMQVRASSGPLTAAALQIMRDCNEGKRGETLLNAACWIAHLLEPWLKSASTPLRTSLYARDYAAIHKDGAVPDLVYPSEEDVAEHKRQKQYIATTLKAAGCIDLVFKQLDFWANEWGGMYGDCGEPVLRALYFLMQHFTDEVKAALDARPAVAAMVRKAADMKRSYNAQHSYFTRNESYYHIDAGVVSIRMQRYLDGISTDLADTSADRETVPPIAAAATTTADGAPDTTTTAAAPTASSSGYSF